MKHIRISIASVVLVLICIGVVMIYSSSGIYALQNFSNSTYFLSRHLLFLSVGFVMMLIMMGIDYRILQKYARPMALITIFLLVAVLIPGIGKQSFGARRWFRLGIFSIQPSEMAKLVMIIYTADFLTRRQNCLKEFRHGFLPIISVMGAMCLLIVKQPDLGSTVSIAMIVLTMMFVAGVRMRYLILLVVMAMPVLYLLIFRVPYRLARIMAFLNPWEDRAGIGFQLVQSQIALGSGGLLGLGLGKSVQKLFYLPAAHTDFILSIIGEEGGLLGTMVVVTLFTIFIWQGARIIKRTTDPFGFYVAFGIVFMIGFQAMVNVGVSIGALPTKGLPLPFVSYGGSALIINMMAVGLLLNISRTQELSA